MLSGRFREGVAVKEMTPSLFWKKANRGSDSECWEWTGSKKEEGYGRFQVDGKWVSAHRHALVLSGVEVPPDLCVLHRCDNPPCCNPSHLFLGTRQENNRDRDLKGRHVALCGTRHWSRFHPERLARGERHGSVTRPESIRRGNAHPARINPSYLARGEKHGGAKLTEEKVAKIREKYALGGFTYRDLSSVFDVSPSLIGLVVKKRIWRHV